MIDTWVAVRNRPYIVPQDRSFALRLSSNRSSRGCVYLPHFTSRICAILDSPDETRDIRESNEEELDWG